MKKSLLGNISVACISTPLVIFYLIDESRKRSTCESCKDAASCEMYQSGTVLNKKENLNGRCLQHMI